MEKASNNKNSTKLSKMFKKSLTIGHSLTPFSPARDFRQYRTASTARRGFFFSSPIVPLIPMSTRVKRRIKNDGFVFEPTSPKVSCIGQIKLAKPKCQEKKNRAATKDIKTASSSLVKVEMKRNFSKLKRFFSKRKSNSTAFAAANEHPAAAVEAVAAPSLCEMKKFATSREALGGFDWAVEMKQEESHSDHRYSMSGSLTQTEGLNLCPKPRSEINLWKRRTTDRPKPLLVNAT